MCTTYEYSYRYDNDDTTAMATATAAPAPAKRVSLNRGSSTTTTSRSRSSSRMAGAKPHSSSSRSHVEVAQGARVLTSGRADTPGHQRPLHSHTSPAWRLAPPALPRSARSCTTLASGPRKLPTRMAYWGSSSRRPSSASFPVCVSPHWPRSLTSWSRESTPSAVGEYYQGSGGGSSSTAIAFAAVAAGVAALGSFLSPTRHPREAELVQYAKAILDDPASMRTPSVDHIIAWGMRVMYLRAATRPNNAWIASCTLMHLCEAVGLHEEDSIAKMSSAARAATLGHDADRLQRIFWISWAGHTMLSYDS